MIRAGVRADVGNDRLELGRQPNVIKPEHRQEGDAAAAQRKGAAEASTGGQKGIDKARRGDAPVLRLETGHVEIPEQDKREIVAEQGDESIELDGRVRPGPEAARREARRFRVDNRDVESAAVHIERGAEVRPLGVAVQLLPFEDGIAAQQPFAGDARAMEDVIGIGIGKVAPQAHLLGGRYLLKPDDIGLAGAGYLGDPLGHSQAVADVIGHQAEGRRARTHWIYCRPDGAGKTLRSGAEGGGDRLRWLRRARELAKGGPVAVVRVTLFRAHPGQADALARQLAENVREVREGIPNVLDITTGAKLAGSAAYHCAIVARYPDLAALAAYDEHPVHLATRAKMNDYVAERLTFVYAVAD
ncbi:MAG: hypothetical protein KatS3mg060_0279 [Dehalococcoidia bacterium]|nr:MAG: hypothetical protein KatS3mg060_0279 [Dehalococcoidia bacterium]